MKITTPAAILISSLMLVLAIMFRRDGITYIDQARADVAGMDRYDLKTDYDFKRAVTDIIESHNFSTNYHFEAAVSDIVEDCNVSGYVDGDYLYSATISC